VAHKAIVMPVCRGFLEVSYYLFLAGDLFPQLLDLGFPLAVVFLMLVPASLAPLEFGRRNRDKDARYKKPGRKRQKKWNESF
jgi:hypothetical protein